MTISDDLRSAELLSWVDVARRLSYADGADDEGPPPPGLVSTMAFWSGLTLRITDDADEICVKKWLRGLFGSWLAEPADSGMHLKLDAPKDMRELPIRLIRVASGGSETPVFKPNASLESEREFSIRFPDRPKPANPPLFAFHSVKGGVGRTTAALAFAIGQARRPDSKPVLLVDADFEAPGISYLASSRKANATVAFEDLLALAHADRTDDFSATLDFVAHRMVDQRIENVYVLPVKRLLNDLAGFAIRPENMLLARRGNLYVVVDLLRQLASRLGCRLVIVDLRAGLTEVSMQFLTDPTVERVFVSTASGQSIAALKSMIGTLGHVERQTETHGRQPFVLFNQLPIYRFTDAVFKGSLGEGLMLRAEASFLPAAGDPHIGESAVTFGFIPHLTDLVATAGDWDNFVKELDTTNFSRLLLAEMKGWSGFDDLELPSENSSAGRLDTRPIGRTDQCRKLQEFAEKREVAEIAEGLWQPMVTPPLQKLASDFLSQVPIAIVEGAKGTGKTLTARYFLEQKSWQSAVKQLDKDLECSFEGPFLPFFCSGANNDVMVELIRTTREILSNKLGSHAPKTLSETESALKGRLDNQSLAENWLNFWLGEIAAAAGFADIGNWERFVASARQADQKPVIVIDGLEEILTDPFNNRVHRKALLSLVREVPLRLREEAGRPIGFVAFIRADMIEAAIIQNLAQFRASYSNYALKWRDVDIKELVVWLVSNSGAIPQLWSSSWRRQTAEDQERDLRRIWGPKLGANDSREARSTEWVISVLTDLTGRLTARDLVRFIGEAAGGSREQEFSDRLLSPPALKRAIDRTSQMKVAEYPKEVQQLDPIFDKFVKHPGFETPFGRDSASQIGVTEAELDVLEKYGVAYQEDGVFEVPELFRIGLGMKRGGARPNIISLTRRARERARA